MKENELKIWSKRKGRMEDMTTNQILQWAPRRPWFAGQYSNGKRSHAIGNGCEHIAKFNDNPGMNGMEAQELTLRAVNSFEAIREALATAAEMLASIPGGTGYGTECRNVANICNRALAIAEGKEVQP